MCCVHVRITLHVVFTEFSPHVLQRSSAAEMSGYKLYYFNARGTGEICRLSFAAANIEFEDIRFTLTFPAGQVGEDWVKEKACEYKNTSRAIFVYASRMTSALTKNDFYRPFNKIQGM